MKSIIRSIIIFISCAGFLHAEEKPKSQITIEITSKDTIVTVKNEAQLMAGYLKAAVLIHGMENIEVVFTNKFTLKEKELVFTAEYKGEKKNGYYRFLQKETGDAITADQDLNKAIKNFIEQNGDNLNVTKKPLTNEKFKVQKKEAIIQHNTLLIGSKSIKLNGIEVAKENLAKQLKQLKKDLNLIIEIDPLTSENREISIMSICFESGIRVFSKQIPMQNKSQQSDR